MGLPSFLSRRKDERTASDVIKDYRSRIEDFVEQVAGRNSNALRGPGDSLERLFQWSAKAHNDHLELRRHQRVQDNALKKAQQEIDTLNKNILQAEREIERLHNRINQLVIDHSREIHEAQSALGQAKREHHSELNMMNQKYDNEKNRLTAQLLVNVHEEREWPDDKLMLRFKELQALVATMASPARVRLTLPESQQMSLDFDSTGFLYRAGKEKAHLLLKSVIWSILYEHFFALPFGFGVLGRQQNTLLKAFQSWHAVVYGKNATTQQTAKDLEIFRRSQVANNWRSATFESAYPIVITPDNGQLVNDTARLSAENLNAAVSDISKLFNTVSKNSTRQCPTTVDEMRDTARLAREIAFQFGVHPAHLRLLVPDRGQEVQIGDEFHDCKNGAYDAGSFFMVDLVTLPGLQKVGDGRSNAETVMTIVPCEIFAQAKG